MVRKTFNGKILLELPFEEKEGVFTIDKKGTFAIWQKGKIFSRTPVDKFKPCITNVDNGQKVKLYLSLLRPSVNGFSEARMELFTFSAEPGNYKLELMPGSSISGIEKIISAPVSGLKLNTKKYRLQVRESQPFYFMLLSIPLFTISGCGMIFGFVGGILADQLFK